MKIEITGLYDQIHKKIRSKYFTKEFYIDFCSDYTEAVNDVILHRKKEKDERYKRTKRSDFYLLDSAEYCRFLEVFNACLTPFRIQVFADPYGDELLCTMYESFPDITDAKKYAKAIAENNQTPYFEVCRVA